MSVTNELCEERAEELFFNLHKEERMTPNICLELEPRRNSEVPKISKLSWQIADKFRQCLTAKDLQCSSIVEFLDTLLTHIKKSHVASHEFTRSICTYLFATKYLASKITLDNAYYDHVRKILVLYCILELSMFNCFDDDSTLASDILTKIRLLMQGSNVVTVMDVLIDIDEEIRSIRLTRSSTIMKIVYRKYLSRSLIGKPVELNDTNFIKHLILFHLWYKAENIERPNVLKMFLSTIKPSRRLRSNPMYAPYLYPYNDDEVDDYKKLIQQPLDQKSLVMALRQVEINTERHHGVKNTILLDLTGEAIVKSEVEVTLNLPGEVINVDDDDDELEIMYLSTLCERLNDGCQGQNTIMLRNVQRNVPVEIVEIGSDSDVESIPEFLQFNNSIIENNDLRQASAACERDSPDVYSTTQTSCSISPCGSLNVKTYSRKSTVKGLILNRRLQIRRKSFLVNRTLLKQDAELVSPILRLRSFTTTTKGKKVTFREPPVTNIHKYVFVRHDYDESTVDNFIGPTATQTSNSIQEPPSHSDSSSGYIVTGPQCNYPYISAPVARHTPPISLSQHDNIHENHHPLTKSKKRRSLTRTSKPRTSINDWIKRKKIDNSMITASVNSERTKSTHTTSDSIESPQLIQHSTLKKCSIRLTRCDTEQQQTFNLVPLNTGLSDIHVRKMVQLSEDVTLKVMGANEQNQTKKLMQDNSEQENLSVQLCDVRNDPNLSGPMRESRVKSLAKTKKLRSLLNASKTKSEIKSAKWKTVRKSKSSTKKCSSIVSNANLSSNVYQESQIRDCFILLEKLDHVVRATSNSSQKSQKLYCNPITNSINHNESICRLPTKSPQEYQFKRSFEKMPANEVTLMSQATEISPDTTVDRASDPLVSKNQLKQSLQSLLPVRNRTQTTTQFMKNELEFPSIVILRSELAYHLLNTVQIQPSTQSIEVPNQTCDTQSSASNLSHYDTNTQQINRNANNYSPDTTTSSVPQHCSISGTNSPCNDMITPITTAHNPINIGKQLRVLYDECDNDIPSPAYSPYVGKRKIGTKQKLPIRPIPKLHQYKCDSDVTTPIDLSKGSDSMISMITSVNDMIPVIGDVSSKIDYVDHNASLDPGESICVIGELLSSRRKEDESSAMLEITNDRISSELTSADHLPESTSLSTTNKVDNLEKPKIYVKSSEQLYHS